MSITSPAAGTIAGILAVSAEATDNTGVVGVQFLLNGNNVGAEDLAAPYSVSWNTTSVTDGPYTLTARARDAAGNITVSSPVAVNVLNNPPDVQAPVVNIISPLAGEIAGSINIIANASDNIAVVGVQFLLNGANLGTEDLTESFSIPWNTTTVANGTYTLTAKARDAAGNITISPEVIVTINNLPDTDPPTINITSPAAGNVSGTISVSASANDNTGVVGVQFLLDGANLGTEDLAAPYSVSWNTTSLANGNHTLTARARDAAGNTAVSTDIVVVVIMILNHQQ